MRYLVTVTLFAVVLIELLLHRIRRDAGGRVDTRYFQLAGHAFALRLVFLAFGLLAGIDANRSLFVVPGVTTGLLGVYFLVLFAYSFPLNQAPPRWLRVSLGALTGALALLTASTRALSVVGPSLLLLYVVPYFGLTLYFLQRNWRAAIPAGGRRPSAPVTLVQAAILAPWVVSMVGFGVLRVALRCPMPVEAYAVQALAMTLVVVGGISVAVLRYHLFEIRVLMAEVVLAVLVAAAFASYLGLAAAPLHAMLAQNVSPAFAAAVVAGVPPFIIRSAITILDRHMNRVACAMARRGDTERGVVEKVLAVTARMVDPEGVLAMVSASVAEVTHGEVRFLRAGRTPPGDHAAAPGVLVDLVEQHPRTFYCSAQRPELPPRLAAEMDALSAELVVPVRRNETLYGFLVAGEMPPLARDTALVATALADHLALKLENHALYTEAATANRQLADVKVFLENLVASLPVGVAVVDPTMAVRAWNPTLAKQSGVSAEAAIGRHYFDDLNPGLLEAGAQGVIEWLKRNPSDAVHREARRYMTPAGEIYRDIVVAPFRDHRGHPNGVVVITQDVTERVRLTRELEESRQLAALGAFAAAIAHDIRTPLTSIQMNVQILRGRECLSESDREYLDIAIEEIDRLNRSVGEILDYAKPLSLAVTATDPRELVTDVVRTLEPVYAERGLTLTRHDDDCSATVDVDERRIRQVLVNLLDNAAAASPRGTTVEVRCRHTDDGLVIEITDEGRGIARENLERIFDPFFTTRADGTGLGLAISRKIARAHGGDIRVTSEVGRGSCFVVVLPVDTPPGGRPKTCPREMSPVPVVQTAAAPA